MDETLAFILAQALTGLASASALFLVASGLSIIFGVTRIVNFAHGSFYMLGAYIAFSLTQFFGQIFGVGGFWLAVAASALAVGMLGLLMELFLLRRLYRAPELSQLLATFGVVLIVQDATLAIWGPEDLPGPHAPGFSGAVDFLGLRIPTYDLFLIIVGPLVLLLLWIIFHRTRWGILVRAATEDRDMAAALGIKQRRLFSTAVMLGAALAGLGGALELPRSVATLGMDLGVIAEAFVVVVVGGMGSIMGAFLAAVLIAELSAFGILLFPQITLVLVFLVMAIVLVLRPHGLLGREERPGLGGPLESAPPLIALTRRQLAAVAFALVGLIALPVIAGPFLLGLAAEMLIFALFAASLQFLMGLGGMISFGHAAYLGLGAYGSALLVKHLDAGFFTALLGAPLLAGIGALAFGWFCVRLSGVYLAMLTLAFAQIAWSVSFQWVAVTGGDNGILGVWPPSWASAPEAFYLLTLALVALALFILRRVAFSPFGLALRAVRDKPGRAAALGIDAGRQRWFGFTLAGVFAGIAGGLYAFLKGSVFPQALSIPTSVDALVMVMLGGLHSLFGPLAGAGLFTWLKAELVAATNFWRLVVGLVILILVLFAPGGLAGRLRSALANSP